MVEATMLKISEGLCQGRMSTAPTGLADLMPEDNQPEGGGEGPLSLLRTP